MHLLENLRMKKIRIRLFYGNTKTGLDWHDCFGTIGTIGRSTGSCKIPILLYNSRSMGGNAILETCIVKIITTKGKRILYQHPNYHI
jgi:hypothetical protein